MNLTRREFLGLMALTACGGGGENPFLQQPQNGATKPAFYVVNLSQGLLSDEVVQAALPVLQQHVDEVAKAWNGVGCTLILNPLPPPDSYQLHLLNQQGYDLRTTPAGYRASRGLVDARRAGGDHKGRLARVFLREYLGRAVPLEFLWTYPGGHELDETMIDPNGKGDEIDDPVNDSSYIDRGYVLPDYTLPPYWQSPRGPKPWDYLNQL